MRKPAGTSDLLEDLSQSEHEKAELLKAIVERAGVGFFRTDLDGTIVFANAELARQLGFDSVQDLLARRANARDFYVDPEDQRLIRKVNDAGGVVEKRLVKMRKAGGEVLWVRESTSPLTDSAGRLLGYIGTLIDVSDLVEAQERQAEAEESYRRIFERATEGIYRSSVDGKQLRSNPALYKLNGYESEAEHLAAVRDIATEWYVDPNRREEFKRLLHENGKVENFESEIYCHGSRERIWISENAYVVRDENGEPLYYEGTVRDITERKNTELELRAALDRAEQASRAKSDFLAQMSHELRTPLNAIIGFSDMLRSMPVAIGPTRAEQYASDIHKSGLYLLDLINDLLDLSKIEQGTVALTLEAIPLTQAVTRAVEAVWPVAAPQRVIVAHSIDGGLAVHADGRALHQCLLNLLSNAVKVSPKGSQVRVSADPTADGFVAVNVRDAGPGIPDSVVERVGQPFIAKLEDRGPDGRSGGLGLAITSALLDRMGGRLVLTPLEAGGTRATALVPMAPTAAAC